MSCVRVYVDPRSYAKCEQNQRQPTRTSFGAQTIFGKHRWNGCSQKGALNGIRIMRKIDNHDGLSSGDRVERNKRVLEGKAKRFNGEQSGKRRTRAFNI